MTDATNSLPDVPPAEADASPALLPLVYRNLRVLVAQRLSHEAPERLAAENAIGAQLVKLRLQGRPTIEQAVLALDISRATAGRRNDERR